MLCEIPFVSEKMIHFREENGVLHQINGQSLLKNVGFLQSRFIRPRIDKRTPDIIVSDAHGSKERSVNLAAACKWLAVNTDETYASQVTNFDGV